MDSVTIVFCEGMHDINFLSKILFVHGYKDYRQKLNNFKKPLGEQYLSILREEKNLESKKIGFNSIYKVPSVALFNKDKDLVLFHNMGGDRREPERSALLSMYQNLQEADDEFTPKLNYKFLYFFDADDDTPSSKLESLNKELALSKEIESHSVTEIDGHQWGCYVFHENDDGGCLEDVLLGLMKPTNEEVFEQAGRFLSSNRLTPEERECEYRPHDGTYKNNCKFKDKKSLISVAGQLQLSGMANSVIIAKSDFIKKEDISNSPVCGDIIKLFIYLMMYAICDCKLTQ